MATLLPFGNYFGTEQKVNEHPLFKLNITHYVPFEDIREHYHENAYLSLLFQGRYQEINRKDNTVMNPGQIILRPAGYQHANRFPETGGSCMNIEFRKDSLEAYGLRTALPESAITYKAGALISFYKILYCFLNDQEIDCSEENIFGWLAGNQNYRVSSRLLWLPKVKQILDTEPESQHSLQAISERVFVHPVYLARAFKEHEGMTIGAYRLRVRIRKAVELLFGTRLSITQIAYAAGFSDTAHFIKSFRLFYPVSPHRFRSAFKS